MKRSVWATQMVGIDFFGGFHCCSAYRTATEYIIVIDSIRSSPNNKTENQINKIEQEMAQH